MPQKIIIDSDSGIGDAIAIAIALADRELDVDSLQVVLGGLTDTYLLEHNCLF